MTRKILIVEDEQDILELLSAILSELGDHCEILRARDGEEALRIARANNPDIILLDIHLPKLNGYDVCKLVKSDASTAHIKVLMLSGVAQNSDRWKAQQVGADGYIVKPFNSITLVGKVEELLGSKQCLQG